MRKELTRLWNLGMVAKDASRARRAHESDARESARGDLIERLGTLHGLPQKIGQLLALSELDADISPHSALTETPSAMPAEAALAEIERCLGAPIRSAFRHLEGQGVSGSLGQVHKGVLHDGRNVAVKIQHPGIAEAVSVDLRALGWLTAPIGGWKRGFDTAAYRREIATVLAEELDYGREARMMGEFSSLTSSWDDVAVPEVVADLSGDRILVMTWMDGAPFSAARGWSAGERLRIGTTLLKLFLTSSFRWGLLHADPNPGNYRFSRESDRLPTLGLLDFGCVRRLDEKFVRGLRDLALIVQRSGTRAAEDDLLACFVAMGFNRYLLEPMAHLLPAMAGVLFEPFRQTEPFELGSFRLQDRLTDILGEYRWNFRFAGPPDLIFFIRAYRGVLAYLHALAVPVAWAPLLDLALDQRAGSATGSERPLVLPGKITFPASSRPGGAKTLRIRVSERMRTKVDLTFRAAVVEHLADIIPDELQPRLSERGIDVDAIARRALAMGTVPGELFQLDEGDKEIRVWLE